MARSFQSTAHLFCLNDKCGKCDGWLVPRMLSCRLYFFGLLEFSGLSWETKSKPNAKVSGLRKTPGALFPGLKQCLVLCYSLLPPNTTWKRAQIQDSGGLMETG